MRLSQEETQVTSCDKRVLSCSTCGSVWSVQFAMRIRGCSASITWKGIFIANISLLVLYLIYFKWSTSDKYATCVNCAITNSTENTTNSVDKLIQNTTLNTTTNKNDQDDDPEIDELIPHIQTCPGIDKGEFSNCMFSIPYYDQYSANGKPVPYLSQTVCNITNPPSFARFNRPTCYHNNSEDVEDLCMIFPRDYRPIYMGTSYCLLLINYCT